MQKERETDHIEVRTMTREIVEELTEVLEDFFNKKQHLHITNGEATIILVTAMRKFIYDTIS